MADPITALLSQSYFGNTLLQYALFLATIILLIIVGKIISFVMKNHLRKIADKTKTDLDDLLLDMIEKPVWAGAILVGFLVGFQFLSFSPEIVAIYYNIFNILTVLLVAWVLVSFVDKFMHRVLAPIVSKTDSKLDDQIIPILSKITKVAIAVLALIIVIGNFGYDVTALVAGLGIGGLAFAFAAQKTIADIFGGFSIFVSKPFIVGDSIEMGDVVGEVVEVGLRHTRIRNLDKRMVIVPNSQISSSVVTNITSAPQRKCVWHIGLTYDTSVAKVEKAKKIIVDAINDHPECENDPIVEFEEFADSALTILVIFYTKENDFGQFVGVRDSIGMGIKRDFEKAKIEFAFPTQTVYVKK